MTKPPVTESLFDARPLGWHVISGEGLLSMLRRVANGEDPDVVYIEEYVNADREEVK